LCTATLHLSDGVAELLVAEHLAEQLAGFQVALLGVQLLFAFGLHIAGSRLQRGAREGEQGAAEEVGNTHG